MANDKATVDHTYEDWYKTIMGYERSYKRWEARVDRIVKKYKDDSRYDRNPNARFNILWSNVQTIQPAIFARLPRPDVSRRFRDNDPIGRVASMMLERALEFEIEHYGDYKSAMNNSVLDRLLGGRGVSWVRYEPHIVGEEDGMSEGAPDDGYQVSEDSDEAETEGAMENENPERIEYECCPVDYVHWKDFGFIDRIIPLGSKETTTLCLYSIKDSYLQFYFKFIKPLKNKIDNNQFKESPILALTMDTYRKWLGFAFERWCRRMSHLIAKKIGFSAIQYQSGSYFKRANIENSSTSFQIDLLYKRADRVLTLCEVKYTSAPVGVSVIKEVENKIELLGTKKTLSIYKILISANGADNSLKNRAYFDQILTLDDLI